MKVIFDSIFRLFKFLADQFQVHPVYLKQHNQLYIFCVTPGLNRCLPLDNFLVTLIIDLPLESEFLDRCISAFFFHNISVLAAFIGCSCLLCEHYLLGLIVMVVPLSALDQKGVLAGGYVRPTFIMEL